MKLISDKGKRSVHTFMMRVHHFVHAGYWRGHHIHSPFVFHIVRDVITVRRPNDLYLRQKAKSYRKTLYASDETVTVGSIGAVVRQPSKRKVSHIARSTSTSEKYGRMLARLAADLNVGGIIELGTSLGVSTAYLAAACPNAKIVTIEGLSAVADVAEANLHQAGFGNVTVLRGDIGQKLGAAVELMPSGLVEMAFVDGNHSEEATLDYFETIASRHAPMCVIVFDDIYWSDGMTRAWRKIVNDVRVDTTIELPQMGLAFFRTGCQKEHYLVRW